MSGEGVLRASRREDAVGAVIAAPFTDGGDADEGDADEGGQVALLWAELEQTHAVRASLVAEQDGQVVGHVGLSHARLDARRELVEVWTG